MSRKLLRAVVRNPLDTLPPEVFTEPLIKLRMGGLTRVFVTDPKLVQQAYVGHADHLVKGENVRRTLGPAVGEGLLTAEGDHWRWQRRSVASAFQPRQLDALLPAMITCAEQTRDQWSAAGTPEVLMGHEMMRTTFAIITETMLSGGVGLDVAAVEKGVTDYLEPTSWMLALAYLRAPLWTPYPGRRRQRKATHHIRTILAEMVAQRRSQAEKRDDLLGRLLAASDPESGRAMSDEEVIDNLVTFISAGHETTALGLAWTFHMLAQHADVEERVQAEIDTVVGEGPVRPEHVAQLAYLRQVFSEAMRLFPPAPIISRTVEEPFELGGLQLAKGTAVVVPIYAIHRHQKLWVDPERFDPDRFTPEAEQGRPRYAYMPFGAGPRACIGSSFAMMEAVAVLAVLLQRFRIHDTSSRAPTPTMRLTLRPAPDILMRPEPRPTGVSRRPSRAVLATSGCPHGAGASCNKTTINP